MKSFVKKHPGNVAPNGPTRCSRTLTQAHYRRAYGRDDRIPEQRIEGGRLPGGACVRGRSRGDRDPGVVGLVDHIKDVCERFAAAGFVALAPDLYHGQTVPPGEPDEAGKAMMAMKLDQAGRDMNGAVDEIDPARRR